MQFFDWLGVTPAESIGLIKKISKKKIKPEDFAKLEERLRTNWAIKNGTEDGFDSTWKMIQSCMAYGFASPHAAATSLDMCYGAYLKVHYPMEYYTVCFNNYADDEVRTNKLRNELKYFGITLSSIKFRHSRAKYSYDKESKTIYKGLESIKYMSSDAAEELYGLRDKEYASWFEALADIKQTSLNSRQLEVLVGLDFFSEFGEINDLLAQLPLFDAIYGKKQLTFAKLRDLGIDPTVIEPLCGKRTAKMFKDFDSLQVLNCIAKDIPHQKTTYATRIANEIEYLGYTQITVPNADPKYHAVVSLSGFSGNIATLYNIRTGETSTIKIKKSVLSGGGIVKGAIIGVDEISMEKKWGKDADGNWYQKDEREEVLTRVTRLAS